MEIVWELEQLLREFMLVGYPQKKETDALINNNLSRAFSKAGYHIACIGRSAENLSKLGKEITEAGGYVSYPLY